MNTNKRKNNINKEHTVTGFDLFFKTHNNTPEEIDGFTESVICVFKGAFEFILNFTDITVEQSSLVLVSNRSLTITIMHEPITASAAKLTASLFGRRHLGESICRVFKEDLGIEFEYEGSESYICIDQIDRESFLKDVTQSFTELTTGEIL